MDTARKAVEASSQPATDQAELLSALIRQDGHLAGCRNIEISLEPGRVVIVGRVSTYYQKSLAQAALMRLLATRNLDFRVINRLEVC